MRAILKSKRGIAIESALLFMLVIMSVSILLTSVIMSAHTDVEIGKKETETRLKLEQIGDLFVNTTELTEEVRTALNESADAVSAGATVDVSDDSTTLTVYNKVGNTLLYIEKSGSQVIAWRYSDPDPNTQK